MKVKLLAIGLFALLAFGQSQGAEARGRCLIKYRGVYFHAPKHKAFATSNGGPASSQFACGASWGGSMAKVKADALSGFTVAGDKITSRVLQLAIPIGGTPAQLAALDKAVGYAAKNNVMLFVTTVK